jgi:para-nitrobenzyl esterase
MKAYLTFAAALVLAAPAFAQPPSAPPPVPPSGAVLAAQARLAVTELPAKAGGKLTVTTPGWKDGADIPFENTQYRGNVFPGLAWSAGPAGTKSYAVIMQDTDGAARGAPFLHWTLYNIPTTVRKLDPGMAPTANPAGSSYGPNYQGANRPYLGPRTPPGPKHRYHMQVFALDTTIPADPAITYDALAAAMKDHVLASGEVIGLGQADPNAPPPAPRGGPAATNTPAPPRP